MTTVIRPELSKRNRYHVEKHRYYELKHFCLQYPIWKQLYSKISLIKGKRFDFIGSDSDHYDNPTSRLAEERLYYLDRINLIEKVATDVDPDLSSYILKGVTEDLSYNGLKSRMNVPCSRDMYYDRYRRFFWLLDKTRD